MYGLDSQRHSLVYYSVCVHTPFAASPEGTAEQSVGGKDYKKRDNGSKHLTAIHSVTCRLAPVSRLTRHFVTVRLYLTLYPPPLHPLPSLDSFILCLPAVCLSLCVSFSLSVYLISLPLGIPLSVFLETELSLSLSVCLFSDSTHAASLFCL